jgi:hypothetical protein
MKKIIVSVAFTALAAPAFAHGVSLPSLLGARVNLGNHGSIASVGAQIASPNALADVKANVLDNSVKADVKLGASQPSYGYGHGASAPSSSLLGLNVAVPGIVQANVGLGQQDRHSSTLLGVTANVLDGGVGRRGGW